MLHSSEAWLRKEALEVRKMTVDTRSKKIHKKRPNVYKAEKHSSESSQKTFEKSEVKTFDSPTSSAQSYSTSDVTPFMKSAKRLKNRPRFKSFCLNSLFKLPQRSKRPPTINQVFQHFDSFISPLKEKLKNESVAQLSPTLIDKIVDEMQIDNNSFDHEIELQKIKMLTHFQERDLETHLINLFRETQDAQKYREYYHYITFRNYYCQKNHELISSKKTLMLLEHHGNLHIHKALHPPSPMATAQAAQPKNQIVPGEKAEGFATPPVVVKKEEENIMDFQQKLLSLPNYVFNKGHLMGEANNFPMNETFTFNSPLVFKNRSSTQTDTETIVGTVRRDSMIFSEQLDTVPLVNSKPEIEASNDYFRKRVFSSNKLEDITDLLIEGGEEKNYDGDKLFCLHDNYSQSNSESGEKEDGSCSADREFIVKEEEPCRDYHGGICTMINEVNVHQYIDL